MSNWTKIGKLTDIPPLGARIVRKGETSIAIFRAEADQIFAMENKCAHKQGPLSEGIVHGCRVTCPLHNWVFDMKTGEAQGADEGTVATFPVKIEDDIIFLSFEPASIANEKQAANG